MERTIENESTSAPAVQVVNLTKAFHQTPVLKGVNLEVAGGEVCCVLGRSGSGKSTLLRCMNLLESFDSGRIIVNGELMGYREKGRRLYTLKFAEIARQRSSIGMVFQRFNLFAHMTALENVMEAPVSAQAAQGGGAGAGHGDARACRSREQGVGVSVPAFRRTAAARGDRPGAGDGPEGDALR